MDPDEYCRERVANAGSDLRYCVRLLAPPMRRSIVALHAYAHELDEAMRIPSDLGVARVRLAWWRGELAAVYTGTPSHPVAIALANWARALPLTRAPLEHAIDARERELDGIRHRDAAALDAWCDAAAGGIGAAAALRLGCGGAATLDRVRDLAVAVELTRILRSVGDDARRGRVRLPEDALAEHGIEPDEVLTQRPMPRLARVLATQARHARARYARGEDGITGGDRRRLAPLIALAAIHRALLDEIERDGFRVLEHRIALTPVRRLWIATRALRRAAR